MLLFFIVSALCLIGSDAMRPTKFYQCDGDLPVPKRIVIRNCDELCTVPINKYLTGLMTIEPDRPITDMYFEARAWKAGYRFLWRKISMTDSHPCQELRMGKKCPLEPGKSYDVKMRRFIDERYVYKVKGFLEVKLRDQDHNIIACAKVHINVI